MSNQVGKVVQQESLPHHLVQLKYFANSENPDIQIEGSYFPSNPPLRRIQPLESQCDTNTLPNSNKMAREKRSSQKRKENLFFDLLSSPKVYVVDHSRVTYLNWYQYLLFNNN